MDDGKGSKRKVRMLEIVLTVICVVFVAEAAAPAASIGNSQFFWWGMLSVTFLLPYGLIAAELGTTYESPGGIYEWVKLAYGDRWGSRTSWCYWVNFPLWMASLAVVLPGTLNRAFHLNLGLLPSILIELLFVWIVIFISFYPICDSVWILNGAAVIKILLAVVVGSIGVYMACTHGLVSAYTLKSLLPSFEYESLSHISVILFNFLGFEIICTFADSMENPKKQIPTAIILGGITVAGIYLFSSFGIGAMIPAAEINAGTGFLDVVHIMANQAMGKIGGVFFAGIAVLFLMTLFGNLVSWSLGVNNVACYAAEEGNLPKIFSRRSKKEDMPIGAALMNGVVATVIIIIAPFIPNEDLFWSFFAVNVVMILFAYLPVFPAFYKLRKMDPDRERLFKVKGNDKFLKLLVGTPLTMLVISLVFTIVPLGMNWEEIELKLPVTVGTILLLVIGEILARRSRNTKKDAKNSPAYSEIEQEENSLKIVHNR